MGACAVIPSYNVSSSIGNIVREIRRQGIEVIVIDDGSSDLTSDEARRSGALVLRNKANMGKGASLRRGFARALSEGYDTIITLDGDGQHLPADITGFLKAQGAYPHAGMIIGNRMDCPSGMPFARRITNKIMSGLISFICNQDIPDTQNGFRLINGELLKKLDLRSDRFEVESEMIIKCGREGGRIISIPVSSVYENSGSQINPITDTLRFIKFILPCLFTRSRPPRNKIIAYP
jgi:glycosyltransferase involved in cell wall biosynthesis